MSWFGNRSLGKKLLIGARAPSISSSSMGIIKRPTRMWLPGSHTWQATPCWHCMTQPVEEFMDPMDPTTPSFSSNRKRNEAGNPGPGLTPSPASSETKETSGKPDSRPPPKGEQPQVGVPKDERPRTGVPKDEQPQVTIRVEPDGNLRIEMHRIGNRDQATQMLMAAWFETLRESITQDVMVGMMQQAQMAAAMQQGKRGGIVRP